MKEQGILSLEIERMPKQLGVAFGNTADYPYYSVTATSTHDMSNIRSWLGKDFAADGVTLFAIGIATGIVFCISAIRQGQVCANGILGISQGHNVFTNTLVYAALPEFYAILSLIAALMV